ncbi:MAG TPA: DUF1345 domain-containing protein [Steroidobacteraceae bacterium]|nr:DUF1345 domain-containing protein [Steroidobacteraceae bacterium]
MNKLFRYHPRVWISFAVGTAIFFVLPPDWSVISRILVCWNCGVLLFLGLIYSWMTRLSAERICTRYIEEDESAQFILTIVVVAALLSVVAIVEPLSTLKQMAGARRIAHIALAAGTLINSWILVPTMFTTHYADLFYSVHEKDRPLAFPNTPMPVFWDFAYFSFTIAAACQTSDVSTTNRDVRKVVIVHTLVSFFFNASILGFAINVTAGVIGGG